MRMDSPAMINHDQEIQTKDENVSKEKVAKKTNDKKKEEAPK